MSSFIGTQDSFLGMCRSQEKLPNIKLQWYKADLNFHCNTISFSEVTDISGFLNKFVNIN